MPHCYTKSVEKLQQRICAELDSRDLSRLSSDKLLTMLIQIKKEFAHVIAAKQKPGRPLDPTDVILELERMNIDGCGF